MLVKGYMNYNGWFSFEIDTDDYDRNKRQRFTSLIFDDGERQFGYSFKNLDELLNQFYSKEKPAVFKKFFTNNTIDFNSLEFEYSESENQDVYDDYDFYRNYPVCYDLFIEDVYWWTEDLKEIIELDVEAATELKDLRWYFWVLKTYVYNEGIDKFILDEITQNYNLKSLNIEDLVKLYRSNEFNDFMENYCDEDRKTLEQYIKKCIELLDLKEALEI